MSEELMRVGISLPADLLEMFDDYLRQHSYTNRSEAVRDLIRRELNDSLLMSSGEEVVGSITMVYDHHKRALSDIITSIQHDFHDNILASTHVHLDHDNCLETVLVRGSSMDIEKLTSRLLALKGVKLGKVVIFNKDLP